MTALSLFSGAGGDTLGLQQAGVNVVGYVELVDKFCETHDSNFTECTLIGNDITKIKDEKFEGYVGKVDIVMATPPCQSFSTAGKKDPEDPRGQLFTDFARVVRIVNPKYIIGENVKGLLSRRTPKGKLFIDVINDTFEKLGYQMSSKVLKTTDYGVPQKRERLIILGCKERVLTFPDPIEVDNLGLKDIVKFDMTGAMKISKETFDFTTIPEDCILTDIDNDDEEDTENIHPYLKLKANSRDVEYKDKVHHTLLSFAKRDSPIHCEIIDIRKPSKTIICTFDHQPRLFVPLHNKNGYYLRCLLPDEYKQIQGFPADYVLCGNLKQTIIQCGNAVPPPLVKAVVKHILK